MIEKISIIIAVIGGATTLINGGLLVAFKALRKEFVEFVQEYKKATLDKKITQKEAVTLMEELTDVVEEGFKFWEIVKKIIPGLKTKIQKIKESKK